MSQAAEVLPEVYSASEIALAAGVDAQAVVRWGEAHKMQPLPGGFFSTPQAVVMVRHLLAGHEVSASRRQLFEGPDDERRRPGVPIAITSALHVALVGALALLTTAARPANVTVNSSTLSTQVVFLATPGPGGGGGGGGKKTAAPASRAERKGPSHMRSAVPAVPPRPIAPPVARAVEPPQPELQPVAAPVVPVAADPHETAGEPVEAPPQPESRGPGADSGAGSGSGSGVGSGSGSGLGDGDGGGTGGGPYRPGSGITPPALLREVKPDYTEEGRRRNVEGDVDLEIVVRRDGSVGDVTVVRGLGAGLDQRAIDAVRQWRFSPATRRGIAVDVIVQVAVEFRLR
jgi:TonB family protein